MNGCSDMQPIRSCPNCGSTSFQVKYVEQPFKVVKCIACSLVYLGNPPDKSSIYENYYEGVAPNAEDYRSDSQVVSLAEIFAINKQRIALVKKAKPRGNLLDIGCGRGYFMKLARDHGFKVIGIDVSKNAVQYARSAFGLPVTVKTLDELRAASEAYDVITLWHVLEHFIDPFEELQKIGALLAEEGVCFIEVPNLYSLKFMLSRSKWGGGNHPLYHRTFFSDKTLKRTLLESGFSTVSRLKVSYQLPGRNAAYVALKRALNEIALDAFLDYAAWK
ncbi:class I SAM-dependent methyltransferase [candidate division TA06 bacterium]|nr:class I SAM-dependent methyltransferase [candidate division TA06 bacterium]